MHEATMMAELRRRLEEVAIEQRAARILQATVWLGRLAHLDETTLRSHWPEVVRGTAAEGSRLVVRTSDDATDPRALGVVLSEVDVEDGPVGSPAVRPARGE
jgi:hydrogenase nickel incorporation protein HypA/HybF